MADAPPPVEASTTSETTDALSSAPPSASELLKDDALEAATKAEVLATAAQDAHALLEAAEEDLKLEQAEAEAEAQEEREFGDAEEAAAVKIQSLSRGKAARKEVARLRKEAAKAQGKAEVAAADAALKAAEVDALSFEGTEDEHAAATRIQALQKGKTARKKAAKLRVDKAKLESELAKVEAKAELQDQRAAAAAAIEAEALIEGTDEETAAARKIQAIQRGRKARAEAAKLRVQMAEMENKLAHVEATAEESEVVASLAVDGDEAKAAVKIQAIQRGRAARRDVSQRRIEAAKAETKLKEAEAIAAVEEAGAIVAERISEEIGEDDLNQQQAAMRIQSLQRGRAARQRVSAMKAERDAAASHLAAVEAEAASSKPSASKKAPSLMSPDEVEPYLQMTVLPAVKTALRKLNEERPEDPFTFLAESLRRLKPANFVPPAFPIVL
ncbi:hypothetical protein RI054_36g137530 [Pseudoscourfieldia marina]